MTTTRTSATVTFWGAAHAVTGSMHLLEALGRRYLLDCGLERGPRTGPQGHNGHFPFAPEEIDALVLTHAHIDHCGNIPALVRQGFAGPVYCTPATRDLVALMWANSARIQTEDAHITGIIGGNGPPPRFTRADVTQALAQVEPLSYGEERAIGPDVRLRLVNAGHILGSAMVSLTIGSDGEARRLTFTGDVGRRGLQLLADPDPVPEADLLVTECTYGGRLLDAPSAAADQLAVVVRRTVERGGKVIIPAFSLGRMQVVVDVLQQHMQDGRLPPVPIYVDSPLAADIARVYRQHPESLSKKKARQVAEDPDLLVGGAVRFIRSHDEHLELSGGREPYIVLAPSGMCEGGRIVQHLKNHIDDPRCTVVLVNYQAPHTPGRQLLEKGPTVRFHGKKWNKWADVVYLAGFSGHADHNDLLALLGPLAGKTARVCLVHGEPAQAEAFARDLRKHGFADVSIPHRGESAALE